MKIEKLIGCARCGGEHLNLKFSKLTRPIEAARYDGPTGDSHDVVFTHWCPCPKNGQPIVLLVRDDMPEGMKIETD